MSCNNRPFTRIYVPAFGDVLDGVGDHTPLFHKIPADVVENITAIQIGPNSDYDAVWVYPSASNFDRKPMLLSKDSPLVGRWAKQELVVIPARVAYDNITPQLVMAPDTVGGAALAIAPRAFTALDLILHHATSPPSLPSKRAPKFYQKDSFIPNAGAGDPGRFIAIVPVSGRKRVNFHVSLNGVTGAFSMGIRAYVMPGVIVNPETRLAQLPLTSGWASIPTQIGAPASVTWPAIMSSTGRTRRTIHFADNAPLSPYQTLTAADYDTTGEPVNGVLLGLRAYWISGAASNDLLISTIAEVFDE